MPKTKVINGTSKPLTLKEGTAGIFTLLKKLQPNECYQIVVDTNATYREYRCAVKADDPDGVVLSSDDCQDLKEVTIVEKVDRTATTPTVTYTYIGVTRESGATITEDTKSLGETQNCELETLKGEVETTKQKGAFMTLFLGLFKKQEKGSSSKSQTGNNGWTSP